MKRKYDFKENVFTEFASVKYIFFKNEIIKICNIQVSYIKRNLKLNLKNEKKIRAHTQRKMPNAGAVYLTTKMILKYISKICVFVTDKLVKWNKNNCPFQISVIYSKKVNKCSFYFNIKHIYTLLYIFSMYCVTSCV